MPYEIVKKFESAIAEFAGSKYAVAVESGTAAIFLSCLYSRVKRVVIPKRTYISVPNSIIHAGGKVQFEDLDWQGVYQLKPYKIYDGALRFRKGMYQDGLHCLSFHVKKHLPIGRGGMILTDSRKAYEWLKQARFDGRDEVPLSKQKPIKVLGYNMYMTPEQAVRGLQLLATFKELPDLIREEQDYPDLSQYKIYG